MKAGVLVKSSLTSLGDKAQILSGLDIISVQGFGSHLFPSSKVISIGEGAYKKRIQWAVEALLKQDIELLVTIGGDGLASYAASAMIKLEGPKPLMLGLAAGTANVGPIVGTYESSSISLLRPRALDAVEVRDGDDILGYAFNDLIIGDTFLGTLDGKLVNLSARALALEDRFETASPGEDILKENFSLKLNGENLLIKDPKSVRQVVVSTTSHKDLAGKAIYGGLINAAYLPHSSAIGFCDRVLVDSRQENWNYKGPVSTTVVCFEPEDELVMQNLGEDASLIIDGNPFIRTHETVKIRCVPNAITALEEYYE